jgi:3-hydroxyacyl-CoA dehydrogenase
VKAILKYGFPVGPMALVDEVGMQVAASVGKNLRGDLGIRVSSADPAFMEAVRCTVLVHLYICHHASGGC